MFVIKEAQGLPFCRKNGSANDAYARVNTAVYIISHNVPQLSQDIDKGTAFIGILKDEVLLNCILHSLVVTP